MICPTCKKETEVYFYTNDEKLTTDQETMSVFIDPEFGSARAAFNCSECNNVIVMTFKLDVVC